MKKIAVLAGDGIGPEIMAQALKVLTALKLPLEFEEALVGGVAYAAFGHPLPAEVVELAKKSDAVLFGAVGDFKYDSLPRHLRPEQARCVLPLCLKTEIVVTANYREWRNIFKLRTPVAAHPQMRELMCPLLKELQSKIPVVFDDIYTYWPKDDQTEKENVEK